MRRSSRVRSHRLAIAVPAIGLCLLAQGVRYSAVHAQERQTPEQSVAVPAGPVAGAGVAPDADPASRPPPAPSSLDVEEIQAEFVALVNELRVRYGLASLAVDRTLTEVALERSQDMLDRGYFSHTIPGVGFAPLWIRDHVVQGAPGVGENLGLSDRPNDEFTRSLFEAWLASPTHLENMVRPEFTRVGIGTVERSTRYPGQTIKVVTQLFAIADGPISRAAVP